MHKEVEQLSITERILASLENPAISVQTIQTPLRQQLKERIYTELYKVDTQNQHLEKAHKNALIARTFFEHLLAPQRFCEFTQVQQALRQLLQDAQLSDYVRETVYYCYDQLLTLNFAELYRPKTTIPERFSPLSELYRVQWPIDNERLFQGTMEIVRYPAITLTDPLPVTSSILDILDNISAASPEYIPMSLPELKKHILEVDYLVVFREKIQNNGQTTYKVAGMTTGQQRHTGEQVFLRAPGIIRSKNEKNGMGTILGAMIARGSLDFGRQDLLIAGFTQNKRVMDFMKMCHPDLENIFISGFHWANLSFTEKKRIEHIIRVYTGTTADTGFFLDEQGIAKNRYPKGNKPDVEPAPIKGLALGEADGVFMLNTVPKNIRTIMAQHTPQTRYKNRFFGEFIKALCTIENFERIA